MEKVDIPFDVTLGTSTPATMLIDTGATLVALPQDVADKLVSVGEATVVGTAQFTIADGTSSTQNIIDIDKLTIGGRTLLKSSSMLSTRQLYRSNNQPASYAA
jgi:predicted aspartyl protease